MIVPLLKKIFGTKNERELKRIQPIVQKINDLDSSVNILSDSELQGKTIEFKERLSAGEPIDSILPEAFAVVREASFRVLKMRHFDVQLIGGIVLHEGNISEMRTGEGKTLVATLPAYLNALKGEGVHVVTVNDYLARRDSEWMGRLYSFLGLSVGCILHHLTDAERKVAYNSDITYGTNNEFGFDYLRDNMKFSLDDYVQRRLHYAIVDEVDSILVDEARTPLIISGSAEDSTDKYYSIDKVIPRLKKDSDYTIDEKARSVVLTEEGVERVEKALGVDNLYDPHNIETLHHVNQGLKAHALFKVDVDYVVKDGEVLIVDEFTGRLMPGRRYSDGLHQALEAKEGVKIENENQTLASITFQNYFRMYEKLAGMTGTAETEAAEFHKIYKLDVMVIPPNRPMVRKDFSDIIYKTEKEKFRAVVNEIKTLHEKGQPVLVGTISIENSEIISSLLKREGVRHHVLNAKHHEREAEIVAQAGRLGAVTIATNMAGRGTDIVLGGNPEFMAVAKAGKDADTEEYKKALAEFDEACSTERVQVVDAGGLHILGTERHESRRIDNQLRGRAGRQGDPGSSRFYMALEDDLLRIFGSERISGIMDRLGMEEDEPIEHALVTRAIETAQKRVEAHNFDIRKHVLEYDDVMNQQRKVIYEQRKKVLSGEALKEDILDMIEELVDAIVDIHTEEKGYSEEWDWEGLRDSLFKQFSIHYDPSGGSREGLTRETVREDILNAALNAYKKKEDELGGEIMRRMEKFLMLQSIDGHWKDHLLSMDHLKEGIGLRGYAQKDPLIEYKREGYDMFMDMVFRVKEDVVEKLFRVQLAREEEAPEIVEMRRPQKFIMSRGDAQEARPTTVHNEGEKVGRNDPCPCGSGKKYKKCHGK
ncbi:MAG: preprotein translocase subunit SecA [Deltaproteobacteria bacterium]|nr:preprotein translocase subunit SecA [Deltaproteobacteria bacterium]